jgi:GWxTD domain-containing protein
MLTYATTSCEIRNFIVSEMTMKKTIAVLLLAVGYVLVSAQSIKDLTTIRSAMFLHPEEGPYVEVYFTISGNALNYKRNDRRLYQGGVDIDIMVLEGNEVINFEKYRLNTPMRYDSSIIDFSLIDQKRLSVPDRSLSLEITIRDIHDSTDTYLYTEALLPLDRNEVAFSDVQFIDTFYRSYKETNFLKNGYEMKPYPINFFPTDRDVISFYGEVYHTDKYMTDSSFLITFNIQQTGGGTMGQGFYQYQKVEAAPVITYLRNIDITELPSGNFDLLVEVRNRKNEVVKRKKVFFQRAKQGALSTFDNLELVNTTGTFVDEYDDEQLAYFLDVLYAVASVEEARLIASLTPRVDLDMKKKFLYNFWLERNLSDPYGEWKKYLTLVKEANESFSTPSKEGYRTDRGRVLLRYGRPYDRLASVNEPGAYPYEIWFYTTIPNKQTNIGFAFYEPSMVTNDYVLLHSNARGELRDPRWKIRIYENIASATDLFDFDQTDVSDRSTVVRAIDMYDF